MPAEDDDQLVGVHADQHLAAQRPRGPADGGVRVLDAGRAWRRRARRPGVIVGPAQRGGPAGQLVGPLAAHEGVDDQGLQPGVPGAAVLGEAGVDVRGGEGDLAAELEDGDVQRVLVAGLGDRGDVVLEDVDGDLDQVDGLLEGDRPAPARGARRRTPRRSAAAACPGSRHHSTSEAMPFCATRVTQERRSAGMARNQGSSSSIRATARVASAPDDRSSRRSVASVGGRLLTRLLTRQRVTRERASGRVER